MLYVGAAGSSVIEDCFRISCGSEAVTMNYTCSGSLYNPTATAAATLHLAKFPSIRRKIESLLIWAGLVLLTPIPLLLGFMMIEASADTSPDKGGAVAAFFMLIIFGGAYGGLGAILLIVGLVQRRNRKATQRLT